MHYKFVKSPGSAGEYDIIITFKEADAEFGMDFFGGGGDKDYRDKIREFISNEGKGLRIRSIKIVTAGVLISSMTLPAFFNAHGSDRFSMSYLYFGNQTQQVNYVNRTNGALDMVSPSYFDIQSDGTLKVKDINKDFVDKMHTQGMKVVPFISNHWDKTGGKKALQNGEALATKVASVIIANNLDGIHVDIENMVETERSLYTAFVKALREKLPSGKEVSVAVAANPRGINTGWQGSYDYSALAKIADYLMIMTYDESWEGGIAGPVASIGFVEKSIQYALTKTTKDKIVLGVPFYGRLWGPSNSAFNGDGVPISTIDSIASKYGGTTVFDNTSKSPKMTFTVKSGMTETKVNGQALVPGNYTLWYENEESLHEKLLLINKYDLKGAGSWALGQEKASLWDNYTSWLEGQDEVNYRDVSSSAWYAPAANFIKEKEIAGKSPYFRPENIATRAECVAWLMKAYGITPNTTVSNQFSDVKASSEYAAYIATARRMGITTGVGNNRFMPDKELTREELFTLLYNTLVGLGTDLQKNSNLGIDSFKDRKDIAVWAEDELDALVKGGIVSGMGEGMLMPKQKATRAQLAQVIYSLLRQE